MKLLHPMRINRSIKSSLAVCLFILWGLKGMSQGNYEPYSQLGIGMIDDSYYNRTTGLANTGLALRSNRFLITNNPASFSGLTNQYLVAEMGIRGSLVNYYGQPVDPTSTQSGDITFRKINLGIKLAKHWGTSFGLVPFSTQNYSFNVPTYVTTTQIANAWYQGYGSVNKVYWANAYEFFHHLSIGVDAGYLFGQLNQKQTIQTAPNTPSLVSTTNDINVSNLYMTYGLQLYGKMGSHWTYSLGGTFSPRTDLFAESQRIVLGPDSVQLAGEVLSRSYLPMPLAYAAGIAVGKDNKYTWLVDYKYQQWAPLNAAYQTQAEDYTLQNSQKVSAGFEVSKKKVLYNTLVELSYLQAGVYYGQTNLFIYGQPIRDYGITLGYGVNALKSPLAFTIGLQGGIRGTQTNDLIEERYVNLTFAVNYGAILYTKGRKYD